MVKKSEAKKTVNKAAASRVEGTDPHHEGFHDDASTVSKSIEETRQYHARYLRAINSPVRREILRALKKGCATIENLQSSTGMDKIDLEWHLSVLEQGFCVEKNIKKGKPVYRLTQEGEVVDRME
jgi:DNA-binding transcriptional ArsR family regulator